MTCPVQDPEEDEEDPDSECRYKCGFTHADCSVVLDHEESAHGRPWEVHKVCASYA